MADGFEPQAQSYVGLHLAARAARCDSYLHQIPPARLLLLARNRGTEGRVERGRPQCEVGYQPPALAARLAGPQHYLAEVYTGHDLNKFIQDVADQEARVFAGVVVDLEHPAIVVKRTCARVAAKAESGVATLTRVLKAVARPDELRWHARARQHHVVAGRRLDIEALAEPWHPEQEEYTEERVGSGEGCSRHDYSVVGTVGRRFRQGGEPEDTVEAVEGFAAAPALTYSGEPNLAPSLAPCQIGIRLGDFLQGRDVALHLLGARFERVGL